MRIYWLIPDRVIYFKLQRNATIDMVKADNQELVQLLNEGQAPIYIIADAKDIGLIPSDINATAKANTFTTHPKLDKIIAVNTNKLHQILGRVIARMSRNEVRFVQTTENALELLKREDTTLTEVTEA